MPSGLLQNRGRVTLDYLESTSLLQVGPLTILIMKCVYTCVHCVPLHIICPPVLQVLITPEAVKEGEKVTLTCNTTCILSNNPTFIWYKNRQPVTFKHTTRDNKLHLNPVSCEDVGSYSCAFRGHESLFSTDVFLKVRCKLLQLTVNVYKYGSKRIPYKIYVLMFICRSICSNFYRN